MDTPRHGTGTAFVQGHVEGQLLGVKLLHGPTLMLFTFSLSCSPATKGTAVLLKNIKTSKDHFGTS